MVVSLSSSLFKPLANASHSNKTSLVLASEDFLGLQLPCNLQEGIIEEWGNFKLIMSLQNGEIV